MLSIVTCSRVPARQQHIVGHLQRLLGTTPHELIVVTDALSLSEGYNRGLDHSKGDIVVFCHDDIEILSPDFVTRLHQHMESVDVLGVAGANRVSGAGWSDAGPPYTYGQVAHIHDNGNCLIALFGATQRLTVGIKVFDGLFLAFRREAIQKLRWDQETFNGFHCYDVDCTLRAHLAGYRQGVALDIPILHYSHGNKDAHWQRFATTFLQKYKAAMEPLSPRVFTCSTIQVPAKEDAAAVMKSIWESLPA